ncbi:MAG: glycosyltransferase family 4 protein, partial [Nitrosotalea sp.]
HGVFVLVIRSEHKSPSIKYFKENGVDVVEIHPPSFIKLKGTRGIGRYINYVSCLFSISKEVSKIIKQHKIDYVYSYMPGIGSSLPATRVKSKCKIPFILDFADLHVFVKPKRIADSAFGNADKILVITEYLRNDLEKKGINTSKIFTLPNGVDLQLFNADNYDKNEIKKLRDSFGANYVIMFAGSLQDLNMIIDSSPKVIREIKNVKYVIIGDHRDPFRSKEAWETKVKSKGLDNHFIFLGKKPKEEIPKYLLCADVCVDSFPDEPYYAAAHPIKLLEYGACEKPIVATRVEETEKLVKHGTFGYLAKPGDIDEYANYIVELLNSPSLREKMGKNFSEFIKKEFSWDYLAQKLEQLLTI